jgi:hypothetical protein
VKGLLLSVVFALSMGANYYQWRTKIDDNAELILAQQRVQLLARYAAGSHIALEQCRDKRFRTAGL